MSLAARRKRAAAAFKTPADAEFDTLDEAIVAALADLPDGGVVAIHAEDCEMDEDDEDSCTCTPMEIVKGPKS